MGAITQDKEIYDQYAVAYFKNDGWDAFAIGKTGRYADVIAVRGSTLAIIEVKSPNEKSAVKSYDDSANLSAFLNSKIGDYLRETRRNVFGLFGSGQSIEQLYAVTITSQIYRYFHEFEEKAAQYEEAIDGSVRLRGARFNKIPCLVIPTEYTKEAEYVLKVLKNNGYISSFRIDKSNYVCVIEYRY
ncbi:MAG: hypothetical protein HY096_03035 [Nitrospinae bacterium]|nr:hypothetical protein [Nitrospinota bacterium]